MIRIERFNDTVFRDDFIFDTRAEAEEYFNREMKKESVVDIILLYCIPYGGETELTRHVKGKPVICTKR